VNATLRICLIASSRFPVREPFMGGLEAHTHALASELVRRGHRVSLFAAPGSDPGLDVVELPAVSFASSPQARADVAHTPDTWMREHHAYLDLMLGLARGAHGQFDVVHNNSLHHLPVAMSQALPSPVVTTLHTPPVPWLESAMRFASRSSRFVAVSDSVSSGWRHAVQALTIPNGVDTTAWAPGAGTGSALWFGRIVPEKAPHEAVLAAHTVGRSIDLAGPVHDADYFHHQVRPLLRAGDRYLGHLRGHELRTVVAGASVAVVTPQWDEPFGLVAAEAMSCGTPVAAYDRGALREVVDESSGVLIPAGDVDQLGRAIEQAVGLDRSAIRRRAVDHFSLGRMVDAYVQLYRELTGLADVA
jgi:glycosyltransferase involved in cell wall biosynthesis